MPPEILRLVRRRAGSRCDYCRLPVGVHPAPFQIDHVVARQHGGSSDADNLAFCCMHCNRYKGPNIAGIDPQTGGVVRLFHLRRDAWAEHFAWDGNKIVGVSRVGTVTIGLLQMNAPEVLALRRNWKWNRLAKTLD